MSAIIDKINLSDVPSITPQGNKVSVELTQVDLSYIRIALLDSTRDHAMHVALWGKEHGNNAVMLKQCKKTLAKIEKAVVKALEEYL